MKNNQFDLSALNKAQEAKIIGGIGPDVRCCRTVFGGPMTRENADWLNTFAQDEVQLREFSLKFSLNEEQVSYLIDRARTFEG